MAESNRIEVSDEGWITTQLLRVQKYKEAYARLAKLPCAKDKLITHLRSQRQNLWLPMTLYTDLHWQKAEAIHRHSCQVKVAELLSTPPATSLSQSQDFQVAYDRIKETIWAPLAKEMQISWEEAEALYQIICQAEIVKPIEKQQSSLLSSAQASSSQAHAPKKRVAQRAKNTPYSLTPMQGRRGYEAVAPPPSPYATSASKSLYSGISPPPPSPNALYEEIPPPPPLRHVARVDKSWYEEMPPPPPPSPYPAYVNRHLHKEITSVSKPKHRGHWLPPSPPPPVFPSHTPVSVNGPQNQLHSEKLCSESMACYLPPISPDSKARPPSPFSGIIGSRI
ncbi:hypothetical protein ACLMJK_004877 [Lecanora helva]